MGLFACLVRKQAGCSNAGIRLWRSSISFMPSCLAAAVPRERRAGTMEEIAGEPEPVRVGGGLFCLVRDENAGRPGRRTGGSCAPWQHHRLRPAQLCAGCAGFRSHPPVHRSRCRRNQTSAIRTSTAVRVARERTCNASKVVRSHAARFGRSKCPASRAPASGRISRPSAVRSVG